MKLLREHVFGNPHSANPTSAAMTELVEQARAAVHAFFRASPEEYVVVFTPNATGALRLVGEAYPFRTGDRFLLTFDNHNSVNGIREFARARGAETTYLPSVAPDLRVDGQLLPRYLTEVGGDHNNLFAFPAQSNFSGVHHPLDWIDQAHDHGWDVLLDAAAYVPTNRLDLSAASPRFRCVVLLQDVRLAVRGRSADRPARCAREARAALVLRRARSSRRSCSASGTSLRPAPRISRTERPTSSTFPRSRSASGSSNGVGIERIHTHVEMLTAELLGALSTLGACKRRAGRKDLRAGRRWPIVARPSPSTSSTPTAESSTSATSIASPAATRSRCAPAASATPAPGRWPSPSRAKRSSEASSATA